MGATLGPHPECFLPYAEMRYPVVPELVDPVADDDPMFGQFAWLLDDPDDDDVEPLDVVMVVVDVAANDAKPTASRAAAAKTARTATSKRARLLGNERILGVGIELYSISFSPPGEVAYLLQS
jgi:hypothetical protein